MWNSGTSGTGVLNSATRTPRATIVVVRVNVGGGACKRMYRCCASDCRITKRGLCLPPQRQQYVEVQQAS